MSEQSDSDPCSVIFLVGCINNSYVHEYNFFPYEQIYLAERTLQDADSLAYKVSHETGHYLEYTTLTVNLVKRNEKPSNRVLEYYTRSKEIYATKGALYFLDQEGLPTGRAYFEFYLSEATQRFVEEGVINQSQGDILKMITQLAARQDIRSIAELSLLLECCKYDARFDSMQEISGENF